MTLANKITIFRILLIVAFMVSFNFGGAAWAWAALLIFCAASASDFLDGYVAKKYNQITTFGKFMDPLADKLLVVSALLCFVASGAIAAWIAVIIIFRDSIVDMMRTLAVSQGKVVAANWWGKRKTAFQMFAIIAFLFDRIYFLSFYDISISQVLLYTALLLTIISGIIYMKDNWRFLSFK